MDFLARSEQSEAFALDPSGVVALSAAKRVRKSAMKLGGEDRVRSEADREFGLPNSALAFTKALSGPLYVPALAPRS
jgi:hypothetical protein